MVFFNDCFDAPVYRFLEVDAGLLCKDGEVKQGVCECFGGISFVDEDVRRKCADDLREAVKVAEELFVVGETIDSSFKSFLGYGGLLL